MSNAKLAADILALLRVAVNLGADLKATAEAIKGDKITLENVRFSQDQMNDNVDAFVEEFLEQDPE